MHTIFARQALTAQGWRRDVRLGIAGGRIVALEADAAAAPDDERCAILLPTLANLHSHAFQRAMAGRAERRGEGPDSFWTWRDLMYRLALSLDADQFEAIAALAYVEMLEAGYGRVGEFHYLHHAPDGARYDDIGELAQRIAAAAETTGIGLTLLPVFYAQAGFGGSEPAPGQRRFVNDINSFTRLHESCREAVESLPEAGLGLAAHSLRAVTPDQLHDLVPLAGNGPFHIHVAEQAKEVEDCLAWSGKRPVEWLLDNAPVGRDWCLIHATHMTPQEAGGLARSGAVVGLCPVTEANLGDGVFPAPDFVGAGGRYGIGTDSNIAIGLAGELRMLEYGQRLAGRARNVMAAGPGSTGRALFDAGFAGGMQALGRPAPHGLQVGAAADFFSLGGPALALDPATGDTVLDSWIFAGAGAVDGVWIAGRKRVSGGRHRDRSAIEARYRDALKRLDL